jgi:hypothetical protein
LRTLSFHIRLRRYSAHWGVARELQRRWVMVVDVIYLPQMELVTTGFGQETPAPQRLLVDCRGVNFAATDAVDQRGCEGSKALLG